MDAHRTCIEAGHCRPRHHSSKDRARWCKGKPGAEHAWDWRNSRDLPNTWNSLRGRNPCDRDGFGYVDEIQVCRSCGKQRGYRSICHCGTLMTRERWSATLCPSCNYTPHWPKKFRDGRWDFTPGRPAHRCKTDH